MLEILVFLVPTFVCELQAIIIPPTTLLEFSKSAYKTWDIEELTIIDLIDNQSDETFLEINNHLLHPSPNGIRLLFNYMNLSTENVQGFFGNGAVIMNSDNPKLFHQLSHGLFESHTWIVPSGIDISTVKLRLDSNLFLYTSTSNEIKVDEVYSIKLGPHIKKYIGSWKQEQGLKLIHSSMWERRKDLSNVTILDAVVEVSTLPVLLAYQTNSGIVAIGYLPELLDYLSDIMHFKVKRVAPADGYFGSQNPNGSWNGMVGMLNRGEVDTCTAGLSITFERSQVIDFTVPLFNSKNTLIVKKTSEAGSINVWAYMKTFTITSWIVTASITIVVVMAMTLIGTSGIVVVANQYVSKLSFTDCIGIVFISLLQRDYHVVAKMSSAHMILLVCSLYSYLIFTYYSATLTSFMTVLEPPHVLASFHDVLKSDYQMVAIKGSNIETFLVNAKPDSVFYNIYMRSMKDRPKAFPSSMPATVKEVLSDPRIAMFGPSAVTFAFDGLVALDLPEALNDYTGIGLQEDSEFTKMFDYFLSKMEEDGIMPKLYHKWFNATSAATTTSNDFLSSEAIVLNYDNLIFPFLILVIGALIAFLGTIMEVFLGRKQIYLRQ